MGTESALHSISDGMKMSGEDKDKKQLQCLHVLNSPLIGPQSPILMRQISPAFACSKSPLLGPQTALPKSERSPSTRCHDSLISGFPVLAPLDAQTSDEEKQAITVSASAEQMPCDKASESPCPRSQRKRGSGASFKLELSPNAASKVSPVKNNLGLFFIEDIKLTSEEARDSQQLQRIVCDVKELWKVARFGGECLEFMEKDDTLKLTALVRADAASDDVSENGEPAITLVGFIVYKLHPHKKYLSVRRLTVSPEHRRQGHAGQIMNWCVRQPGVNYLALTSTAKALEFYKAFGFRKVETWHQGGTAHPDDEPKIGEVYMEYNPSKDVRRRKPRK